MNTKRNHENQNFGGGRQAFAPLAHKAIRSDSSARKGSGKVPIYEMSPEYTQKGSTFFRSDQHDIAFLAKHEIVDASIVIYGISGIMCEKEKEKMITPKKLFGRSKAKGLASATFQTRSMDSKNWSSSFSSLEDGGLFSESESNPIYALVSITTSYAGHDMDYETFLPSIPLHRPSVTDLTARYTALWPAFMDGETAKEHSCFNIVRTMQESQDENGREQKDSKYVHETVELCLSLSMGTEMVPLGTASIVLSGEEEVEVKMNVPARASEHSQKGKHKKKSKSKRLNKDGYFSSDLTKRYFLEENATLRIGVQVLTEKAKKRREKEQKRKEKVAQKTRQLELVKKQQEDDAKRLKELRTRMERVTMENTKRRLRMKRQIYYSNFDNTDDDLDDQEPTIQHTETTRHNSFAPNLICAMPNMMCAEEGTIDNKGKSYMTTGSITLSSHYGHSGFESTMSSVSNSMYGSEMGSDSFTDNGTYFTDYGYQ